MYFKARCACFTFINLQASVLHNITLEDIVYTIFRVQPDFC